VFELFDLMQSKGKKCIGNLKQYQWKPTDRKNSKTQRKLVFEVDNKPCLHGAASPNEAIRTWQ